MEASILIIAGPQHFPAVPWSSNGIYTRAGVLKETTLGENVERVHLFILKVIFFWNI